MFPQQFHKLRIQFHRVEFFHLVSERECKSTKACSYLQDNIMFFWFGEIQDFLYRVFVNEEMLSQALYRPFIKTF